MEFEIDKNGQRGLEVDGIWFCEELIVSAIHNLKEDKSALLSILDKSRAVCASWEQYKAADALDLSAKDAVGPHLESGLNRLVVAVDEYDKVPGGGE